jgi:hypothetical protein
MRDAALSCFAALSRSRLRFHPMRCCGIFVLTLAIVACSEPEGCDICTTSAVVYGTVRQPGGAAVASAPVLIGIYRESCDGEVEIPGDGLITAADGSYRTQPAAFTGQFTACVRVTVQEPGSSGDPGVTVEGAVEFLPDFGSGQQRDSVRVDVELTTPVVPL